MGALLSAFLANGIAELLCCASEMSSRRDLRSHPLCPRETAAEDSALPPHSSRALSAVVAHVAFVTNGNIAYESCDLRLKFPHGRLPCSRQISFTCAELSYLFESQYFRVLRGLLRLRAAHIANAHESELVSCVITPAIKINRIAERAYLV